MLDHTLYHQNQDESKFLNDLNKTIITFDNENSNQKLSCFK